MTDKECFVSIVTVLCCTALLFFVALFVFLYEMKIAPMRKGYQQEWVDDNSFRGRTIWVKTKNPILSSEFPME